MFNYQFSLLRFSFAGLACSSVLLLGMPEAFADKISASAAFDLDTNGMVKTMSIGVAIGSQDAYSRSFYDSNTRGVSSISVGSASTIQCDGSPCNQPANASIEIGPVSGTTPVDTSPVPKTITTGP